ncbi:MAG: hypothetical protein ACYTF8_09450 [Planctomycetota bacterium]
MDLDALAETWSPAPVPVEAAEPTNGDSADIAVEAAVPEVPTPAELVPPERAAEIAEPADEVMTFYQSFDQSGSDRQADAALLFAYYLQRKEGLRSLRLGDLIRCCIRAGVDTRNFNRTVGALTRRGFLETVRHGHAYRLSEQGVAVVENRM